MGNFKYLWFGDGVDLNTENPKATREKNRFDNITLKCVHGRWQNKIKGQMTNWESLTNW